jgi:hypothetical protein
MNLRTHTYTIPALTGLAAFAMLVAADFSFRRMTHGPDYGFAAYVTDVNHKDRDTVSAAPAEPRAMIDEGPVLAVVGPEPLGVTLPNAEPDRPGRPVAMQLALGLPTVMSMPLRMMSTVSFPDLPAEPSPALADVPVAPPDNVEVAADEPPAAQVVCTSDQGFKRCRIGQ